VSNCIPPQPDQTLFVTDLDGTLLLPDASVSSRSAAVINEYIAQGGLFTYATARSYTSASRVTNGLQLELPVITYGGAITVDPKSGQQREAVSIGEGAIEAVLKAATDTDALQPILFVMHEGRDRICWLPERATTYVDRFIEQRKHDPRLLPLENFDALAAKAFYVSIIGNEQTSRQLQARLGEHLVGCTAVLSEDVYNENEYWYEITSDAATKAVAITALQQEIGASYLVCSGDNKNDLPMFAIADKSLAVANSSEDIRAAVNEVIPSNVDEGVARWISTNLLRNFNKIDRAYGFEKGN
jgi:Cof subfamily protein (haloacid dehalogenase superfamily)